MVNLDFTPGVTNQYPPKNTAPKKAKEKPQPKPEQKEAGIAGTLKDIFYTTPVTYWTGKKANEIAPKDAAAVYAAAALWPLTVLNSCGGTTAEEVISNFALTFASDDNWYNAVPEKPHRIQVIITTGNKGYDYKTDLEVKPSQGQEVEGNIKVEKAADFDEKAPVFLVTFPKAAYGKREAKFDVIATTQILKDGEKVDTQQKAAEISATLKYDPMNPTVKVNVGYDSTASTAKINEPTKIAASLSYPNSEASFDSDNFDVAYDWTVKNLSTDEELPASTKKDFFYTFTKTGGYHVLLSVTLTNKQDHSTNTISLTTIITVYYTEGDLTSPSISIVSDNSSLLSEETGNWIVLLNPKDENFFSYQHEWFVIKADDPEKEELSLADAESLGLITYSLSQNQEVLTAAFHVAGKSSFQLKCYSTLTSKENSQETYVRTKTTDPFEVNLATNDPDKPRVDVFAPDSGFGGNKITIQAQPEPYSPATHEYTIYYKLYRKTLDGAKEDIIPPESLSQLFWDVDLPVVEEKMIVFAEVTVKVKNRETQKELSFTPLPAKIEVRPQGSSAKSPMVSAYVAPSGFVGSELTAIPIIVPKSDKLIYVVAWEITDQTGKKIDQADYTVDADGLCHFTPQAEGKYTFVAKVTISDGSQFSVTLDAYPVESIVSSPSGNPSQPSFDFSPTNGQYNIIANIPKSFTALLIPRDDTKYTYTVEWLLGSNVVATGETAPITFPSGGIYTLGCRLTVSDNITGEQVNQRLVQKPISVTDINPSAQTPAWGFAPAGGNYTIIAGVPKNFEVVVAPPSDNLQYTVKVYYGGSTTPAATKTFTPTAQEAQSRSYTTTFPITFDKGGAIATAFRLEVGNFVQEKNETFTVAAAACTNDGTPNNPTAVVSPKSVALGSNEKITATVYYVTDDCQKPVTITSKPLDDIFNAGYTFTYDDAIASSTYGKVTISGTLKTSETLPNQVRLPFFNRTPSAEKSGEIIIFTPAVRKPEIQPPNKAVHVGEDFDVSIYPPVPGASCKIDLNYPNGGALLTSNNCAATFNLAVSDTDRFNINVAVTPASGTAYSLEETQVDLYANLPKTTTYSMTPNQCNVGESPCQTTLTFNALPQGNLTLSNFTFNFNDGSGPGSDGIQQVADPSTIRVSGNTYQLIHAFNSSQVNNFPIFLTVTDSAGQVTDPELELGVFRVYGSGPQIQSFSMSPNQCERVDNFPSTPNCPQTANFSLKVLPPGNLTISKIVVDFGNGVETYDPASGIYNNGTGAYEFTRPYNAASQTTYYINAVITDSAGQSVMTEEKTFNVY